MQRVLITILIIALSGCAQPAIKYGEYMQKSPAPDSTHIRFVLFRPKDSFDAKIMGGARSVRIKIDDQTAGYIGLGFQTFDLPAGKHTISVDLWNKPGKCDLEVTSAAGSEYYFQIGPRNSIASAAVGDLVGRAVVSIVGLGLAVVGTVALNAVSRPHACGGDFYIQPVEKKVADSKFANLEEN